MSEEMMAIEGGGRTHQKREQIAEVLRWHRETEATRRREDEELQEARREHTRNLVKLMKLETNDHLKTIAHAAQASQLNEVSHILGAMRALEDRYQQKKKSFAMIPDKKLRHERVQAEKEKREAAMIPLRDRLRQVDPTIRPSSSFQSRNNEDDNARLPLMTTASGSKRKTDSTTYRRIRDKIRDLQKERKNMLDPYVANLQLAKLWLKINDQERALENYEKACKSLSDKKLMEVSEAEMAQVQEQQRRRKRTALQFLFTRSLALRERKQAADQMRMYLSLSAPSERVQSVERLEGLLRNLSYIEDPSLLTPDDVRQSILATKSLGPLTDLRFELLQEMLELSPTDPYLLESVSQFQVRKTDYMDAKTTNDRFVKLPDVKRLQLFASFCHYTPSTQV
ncbi:hypothetical protein Poli38472_000267 [Pythium oligandrum]|uniref:Uncharacterized protein n=1 Tax=Pythium oligandrum TaxID=41045 RepID=A0A8K1FE74_PYTOL|nr:hypothetical protein Poli38472_000267 [Pythium oligandrum]|eukprot:TMW60225.1 hypothetical protein Poli38472_000267 [Pythium oligandrum]